MEYCPVKGKGRKGVISKTWERCKSFSGGSSGKLKMMSKSWPRSLTDSVDVEAPALAADKKNIGKKWKRVGPLPEGCFSIYVGPQKQRFVIKTEYVNHPLFRDLLEEAESEYGYSSDGPLLLPCEVDRFLGVLTQMMDFEDNIFVGKHKGRNFVPRTRTHQMSCYHLLTPPRFLAINSFNYS